MKDKKFKSLQEPTSPELNQRIIQDVTSALEINQRRAASNSRRVLLGGWLISGLALASLFAVWGRSLFQTLPIPHEPTENPGPLSLLDFKEDLEFSDFDEDFELLLSEEFDEIFNEETEG